MSKREDAEEDKVEFHFNCSALVDDDVDFPDLPLKDRVLILQQVKILARFTIVEYLKQELLELICPQFSGRKESLIAFFLH